MSQEFIEKLWRGKSVSIGSLEIVFRVESLEHIYTYIHTYIDIIYIMSMSISIYLSVLKAKNQ